MLPHDTQQILPQPLPSTCFPVYVSLDPLLQHERAEINVNVPDN